MREFQWIYAQFGSLATNYRPISRKLKQSRTSRAKLPVHRADPRALCFAQSYDMTDTQALLVYPIVVWDLDL